MIIAAFEGFYGGSHKQWLDGLISNSRHEIIPFALPARAWKWRMRGGAITLAHEFLDSGLQPDCFLVTDMLDVPLLISLAGPGADCPFVLYMHENQLTYPWSPTDPDKALGRDHHYGFINYISCLVADRILFNSHYHRDSFLEALPGFLRMFPDYRELGNVEIIRQKSEVLPPGLDLKRFDHFERDQSTRRKTILWNHRWEYDKDPSTFFEVLSVLSDEGLDFDLIVCGESTGTVPDIFPTAKKKLRKHIAHWGTAANFNTYAELLKRSDILPVTSRQDFFGISAIEAIHCGVYPLLPDRLAFPEHLPEHLKNDHTYSGRQDLLNKLRGLLSTELSFDGTEVSGRYDWGNLIDQYDGFFKSLV